MAAFTDHAENLLIDWLFRGQTAPALPASWYFGLLLADPGDDATPLSEVTAAGYARLPVTRALATFAGTQGVGTTAVSTGSSATTSNIASLQFAAPVTDWGTIAALGIFNAAAGGDMWFVSALTTARAVHAGDAPPTFLAAAFSFCLDAG